MKACLNQNFSGLVSNNNPFGVWAPGSFFPTNTKKEKIWWLDQESCHHFVGVWQNAVAPVVGFGVTKGRQWTRAHTRGSPLSKTKQPNLQYWSWVDWCCKVKSNGSATQKIHLVLGSVALFTARAPDKSIDATFQHVFNEKAVFSIFGAKNSVFYIN